MKTMTGANLKAQFSSGIEDIRNGEEVLIEYGKRHQKLGVIVPYNKYKPIKRKTGLLGKNASFKINGNFKISDDELLSL